MGGRVTGRSVPEPPAYDDPDIEPESIRPPISSRRRRVVSSQNMPSGRGLGGAGGGQKIESALAAVGGRSRGTGAAGKRVHTPPRPLGVRLGGGWAVLGPGGRWGKRGGEEPPGARPPRLVGGVGGDEL